jgi:hypothetical protein
MLMMMMKISEPIKKIMIGMKKKKTYPNPFHRPRSHLFYDTKNIITNSFQLIDKGKENLIIIQ